MKWGPWGVYRQVSASVLAGWGSQLGCWDSDKSMSSFCQGAGAEWWSWGPARAAEMEQRCPVGAMTSVVPGLAERKGEVVQLCYFSSSDCLSRISIGYTQPEATAAQSIGAGWRRQWGQKTTYQPQAHPRLTREGKVSKRENLCAWVNSNEFYSLL